MGRVFGLVDRLSDESGALVSVLCAADPLVSTRRTHTPAAHSRMVAERSGLRVPCGVLDVKLANLLGPWILWKRGGNGLSHLEDAADAGICCSGGMQPGGADA